MEHLTQMNLGKNSRTTKLHEFLMSNNLKNIIPGKNSLSTTASIKRTDQTTDDSENQNLLQK